MFGLYVSREGQPGSCQNVEVQLLSNPEVSPLPSLLHGSGFKRNLVHGCLSKDRGYFTLQKGVVTSCINGTKCNVSTPYFTTHTPCCQTYPLFTHTPYCQQYPYYTMLVQHITPITQNIPLLHNTYPILHNTYPLLL